MRKLFLLLLTAFFLSCAVAGASPVCPDQGIGLADIKGLLGKSSKDLEDSLGKPAATKTNGCHFGLKKNGQEAKRDGDLLDYVADLGTAVVIVEACMFNDRVIHYSSMYSKTDNSLQIIVEELDTAYINKILSGEIKKAAPPKDGLAI